MSKITCPQCGLVQEDRTMPSQCDMCCWPFSTVGSVPFPPDPYVRVYAFGLSDQVSLADVTKLRQVFFAIQPVSLMEIRQKLLSDAQMEVAHVRSGRASLMLETCQSLKIATIGFKIEPTPAEN